jgi:tRNA threonylcarbamoyladenosine biosynthesis protein TsaE
MQRFQINITGIHELDQVAQELINSLNQKKLLAIYGKMGAGKTTFIKSICKYLDVIDVVNSPTFSIINQYECSNGDAVFHFDFYRIEKPQEALDIGIFEYWDSGMLCLMEWPEKVEKLLPEDCVYLKITEDELSGDRLFEWEV